MRVDSRRRWPPSRSKHLPAICYRSAESLWWHEIAVKPSLSMLPVLFSRGEEVVKLFPRQPHFSPFLRLALSYLLSAPQVDRLPPESFHRRTDGRERGDTHRPVCGAAHAHANAHKQRLSYTACSSGPIHKSVLMETPAADENAKIIGPPGAVFCRCQCETAV